MTALARPIPLLVIAGPTATGKTEAAIRVARAVGGEIVSADSMQIYRGLDVGTAKPSPEQRTQAPFHLVDCVEPDRAYTVADYQRDADAAIRDIWGRGLLPLLCGGTGLYLRAVTWRLQFPPKAPETGVRAQARARLELECQELGPEALHRRLAATDPAAAARISPRDARRTVRALEVLALTGRPMSALQRVDASGAVGYNRSTFALTCPRAQLYARIEARVDQMMAAGWLEEVRALRARGLPPGSQCLQAIGYRHLAAWLQAGEDLRPPWGDVVEAIKRDTRRFAKRQLTWLRHEPEVTWLDWSSPGDFERVVEELCRQAENLTTGPPPASEAPG